MVALMVLLATGLASGNWVHFSDQCFRPDGTIARTEDTLNTFEAVSEDESGPGGGGVSRVRIIDWSPSGASLQKRSRLLDLQTKKPVKSKVSFPDEPDVFFRRVSDLPFYSLLSDRLRGRGR